MWAWRSQHQPQETCQEPVCRALFLPIVLTASILLSLPLLAISDDRRAVTAVAIGALDNPAARRDDNEANRVRPTDNPGNPRDPRRDQAAADSLISELIRLNESPCLRSCGSESCDSTVLVALGSWRDAAAQYYREPLANPLLRARVITLGVLLPEGPDIWQDALNMIASLRLSPPPGNTWEQVQLDIGAKRTHPGVALHHSPPSLLYMMSAAKDTKDKRMDLAVALTATLLPDSECTELLRQLTDVPTEETLQRCVVAPARRAVDRDLLAFYRSHGSFPSAVVDGAGRPDARVLPSLHRIDPGLGDAWNLPCWFTGSPGFRLTEYRSEGQRCSLVLRRTWSPATENWDIAATH